jgi:GNAT superfamily N-acetyltransferase
MSACAACRWPALPVERASVSEDLRERRGQQVAIRPLRPGDLDLVGALQEASIRALGASTYSPAQLEAWARFGWQDRHTLVHEGGTFFVAEQSDRIVGVGGWSSDSLAAELAWLRYVFVHPDHAGQGVGRQLVETIEASARRQGKCTFRVWSSLNATGFYGALGYRRLREGRWPVTGKIELGYVLLIKGS